MEASEDMRIRLRFKNGLGDAVQFTVVLKHLRHYHPKAHIILESTNKRDGIFRHLVDELLSLQYPFNRWDGQINKDVTFPHCKQGSLHYPSTKILQCLEELQLHPLPDLWRYSVSIDPQAALAVDNWLEQLPGLAPVVIHYEGRNSPERKNIPRPIIEDFCKRLAAAELTPILLDWGCNKIADGKTVFVPTGLPQDADHVAALIDKAVWFLGIDSGPGHIAAALETPGMIVWREFAPVHNFDPSPNLVHLVPESVFDHVIDDYAADYMGDNYKLFFYGEEFDDFGPFWSGFADELIEEILGVLKEEAK